MELIIGSTTYICADNFSTNHPHKARNYNYPPRGAIVLPVLKSALNALPLSQWQAGLYLTIVQGTNNVWLFAQDASRTVLGFVQIPNLTTVSGNVVWQGSWVANPLTASPGQTVLYKAPII